MLNKKSAALYLVTFPPKIWIIPTVRPLRFIIAQQSAESLLIRKKGETLALRYRPLLKDTEISMSFNLPETAHRPGGLVESQLMQTEEEETRIEIN